MTSFLDYYKIILEKVSFDPLLLRKEYQKAKCNLCGEEIRELNKWLRLKEITIYPDEHFKTEAKPEHVPQHIMS